jgi:heterodisulfide reductase subunit A-like polyferredoxin
MTWKSSPTWAAASFKNVVEHAVERLAAPNGHVGQDSATATAASQAHRLRAVRRSRDENHLNYCSTSAAWPPSSSHLHREKNPDARVTTTTSTCRTPGRYDNSCRRWGDDKRSLVKGKVAKIEEDRPESHRHRGDAVPASSARKRSTSWCWLRNAAQLRGTKLPVQVLLTKRLNTGGEGKGIVGAGCASAP